MIAEPIPLSCGADLRGLVGHGRERQADRIAAADVVGVEQGEAERLVAVERVDHVLEAAPLLGRPAGQVELVGNRRGLVNQVVDLHLDDILVRLPLDRHPCAAGQLHGAGDGDVAPGPPHVLRVLAVQDHLAHRRAVDHVEIIGALPVVAAADVKLDRREHVLERVIEILKRVPPGHGLTGAAHVVAATGAPLQVADFDQLRHLALGSGVGPDQEIEVGPAGQFDPLVFVKACDDESRFAGPKFIGEQQVPPHPDAHGVGRPQAEHEHRGQQHHRQGDPPDQRTQIEDLPQPQVGHAGQRVLLGVDQHLGIEGCGVRRRLGQLDRGQQAVLKTAEAAFQQHRHAAIAQRNQRPAKNPAQQHPGQRDSRRGDDRDPQRRGGLEQPVERQADPERQPQHDRQQRDPVGPDIRPDRAPQAAEDRVQARRQSGRAAGIVGGAHASFDSRRMVHSKNSAPQITPSRIHIQRSSNSRSLTPAR